MGERINFMQIENAISIFLHYTGFLVSVNGALKMDLSIQELPLLQRAMSTDSYPTPLEYKI